MCRHLIKRHLRIQMFLSKQAAFLPLLRTDRLRFVVGLPVYMALQIPQSFPLEWKTLPLIFCQGSGSNTTI